IKKYIVVFLASFVFVMAFYSMAITKSRFDMGQHRETPVESIARYFGESFPNLGYSFWDKVRWHPMGERLFPEVCESDVSQRFKSVDSSYYYWKLKTHVPILNFKTLFGDLYIEFGVLGALLFVIVLSKLFSLYMKGQITCYNIAVAYYYFQICSMGFAGITRMSGFYLVIIALILIECYVLKRYAK
ncbi:MAG: oligosaccharide repeat unit polymerase, partial [Prevotella sp.]|nr:oligosaccharide repeat unit polymerase [Prevotella sp.]